MPQRKKKSIRLFLYLLLNIFLFLPSSFAADFSFFNERKYCLSKQVDYRVVEAIADIESVKIKGYQLGYPFVIRVNNPRVRIRGLKRLKKYGNVYDCINQKLCEYTAKKLISNGIKNFDMGVFQINYLYNRNRKNIIKRAFNTKEAYKIACDIVSENIKKHGFTPRAVAMYHSGTPYLNRIYAKKFIKIYERKIEKKKYGVYKRYFNLMQRK